MIDHTSLSPHQQRGALSLNTRTLLRPRGICFALHLTRFTGRAIGLIIFAVLVVVEPLVRFLLMTLATLGMFVTIVFGFLIATEGFPKWTMLGMSVGCFVLLVAYYGMMSFFGKAHT